MIVGHRGLRGLNYDGRRVFYLQDDRSYYQVKALYDSRAGWLDGLGYPLHPEYRAYCEANINPEEVGA